MSIDKTPQHIKLDERNHVEKPFLDQLSGLGWEILDLDSKQHPGDTFRASFTEVVMPPVLREQLKIINPWLDDGQVEDVVKQLTASFPGTGLIENNRHVLNLLLENTSISENRKTGEKSPTVRFIDFNRRDHNRFIAVCQLKVRILGTEYHIVPDIVLFLNGLPVVVIECKSPKVKEPMAEAIDQMLRYSEQRGARGEGSAPLFYYNQFVVATCRQEAKFGTITTHSERLFFRWADPYPRTVEDLEHGAGGPNDQQRLVAGMLDRDNLLDLIRTFTLFSTNDKGETIKIVGRYQQFRAVKLGVQRLLEGRNPRERSGIIWHTQGSGKSLTMMFMVREMYRHPTLSKWKVVFVTDRTQLEQQLSETSRSIGFSVKVADSIRTLKELLRSDTSDLVMAMIHKFREADLTQTFPELNTGPHILVMTDEAHRSQYAMLGANLDNRDMLLTGFDAPVEQVMYLDKVIVAHNLLQAIARVNRVGGEGKDKGFVVDYVGIGHHLKKAIEISDEREQKDVLDALSFPEKELNELRDAHRAIMAFFEKHCLTDLDDHDAFFDLFYDEDLRFEYLLAFKNPSSSEGQAPMDLRKIAPPPEIPGPAPSSGKGARQW